MAQIDESEGRVTGGVDASQKATEELGEAQTQSTEQPPKKPRAADPRPARTRAAIFRAALELSVEGGDLTVNDIVKRAGVSRASFYAHFSNLEDVAFGLIRRELEELHQSSKAPTVSEIPIDIRIRDAIRATTVFLAENRALLRGVLSWRISHQSYAYVVDVLAEYWAIALSGLRDRMPEGMPAQTAHFLSGGVTQLYVDWLLDDSVGPDADLSVEAERLGSDIIAVLPQWLVGDEGWHTSRA